MSGKITLITPPDIYENDNPGILFVHINDQDQETVSKWLAAKDISTNYNFYIFSGELDVPWLFFAMGASHYKYIDIDDSNDLTKNLMGYLLGKNNVYYKTANENLAAIYSHINLNRVSKIESFLEKVFSEQSK